MWCEKTVNQVEKELKTSIEFGLTEKEALKRLHKYGENKLKEGKKDSIIVRFIKQFNDFMIIILLITSVISAITTKVEGSGDYIDSIIIIAIVFFNALMGLIQEYKAEKSLEALKKMSSPTAMVKRDGKIKNIKAEQIVIGDIILLEAGKYVPADCRLVKASSLQIEEASLTGENIPVQKNVEIINNKNISLGDMKNCAFSTTIVINGHGEAIVTETGMNTSVGKIAKMIDTDSVPQTPIQKKLEEVGKTLGIVCLLICAAIFIIGIFKKIPILEMFMTSIGLAVAAIPEGLPAIVTIILSLGVTRLAKKNVIIRKLPAVETLGSSSVICSDKTGTLTQNQMQVVDIFTNNNLDQRFAIQLATMCTDCNIEKEKGKIRIIGDPTEIALVESGIKYGENKEELYKKMQRIKDIPFDSTRKLMSTIHKNGINYRIITKGAPDVLLKKCSNYYSNGKVESMNSAKIKEIENKNQKMAEKALRVIAVAYVDTRVLPKTINSKEIEKNLIFVGLIGMIDPPRKGVKEAITTCKKAGIKTVMITGDHIVTAKAIALELGILNKGELAITGNELEKMPQNELEKNIQKYSVFARVSPEHKVRIVKAFQSTGAIVAMTGDGVNDAPALKNANIGISMGENGTDVAKNASDMILTDDNFVTIVSAVKQGRNIFDNIIKTIHFLIATNIAEIFTIFVGLILGFPTPLVAIQLLWINLVTDSLPGIALGLEPAERNIMDRKPRNIRKSIFADGLWSDIFLEGVMLGTLTLIAFWFGNKIYGLEVARTMAFISLGMLELVHSINVKSKESLFKSGIFKNKYLVIAFIICSILQLGTAIHPTAITIFKLVKLNRIQWLYTMIISVSPILIVELQKMLNKKS